MTAARPWQTVTFVAFTLVCVAAALLVPAMPQPLEYHDFVDDRTLWGIPNFQNVVSNLAFVLAGAAGFVVMARTPSAFVRSSERWPYYVFFAGLVLTGLGSAYYHLDPNNETLFWDRLPMTFAFAGLVAAQIDERMSPRLGIVLLPVLLVIGAASVVHWLATERAGVGNVLPYAILQGYTMAAVLLLAFTHPSRYTRASDIYWVFAAYLAAKITETLDVQIWEWTAGLVSGHMLKHLFAALSGVIVCITLLRRRPHDPSAAA
jgi:hypothetical protein